jgi:hypothetical protein
MDNWITVFTSKERHRAEIVKAVLLDRGLNPIIIDKQDRSYIIGTIEVKVIQAEVFRAANIVKNEIQFE